MTSPNGELEALRDHVLAELADKRWDQNVLARAMDYDLRTINKICTSGRPKRVNAQTYAALDLALGWPTGRARQIVDGRVPAEEAQPSIGEALKRLRTAQESVQAAERILRLLQTD